MEISQLTNQKLLSDVKKLMVEGMVHSIYGLEILSEMMHRQVHTEWDHPDFYTFCQKELNLTDVSVLLEIKRRQRVQDDVPSVQFKMMELLWK